VCRYFGLLPLCVIAVLACHHFGFVGRFGFVAVLLGVAVGDKYDHQSQSLNGPWDVSD